MPVNATPSSDDAGASGLDARTPTRVIASAELLGGRRRLLIEHDGEIYTLQLTRQGKLLLTK